MSVTDSYTQSQTRLQNSVTELNVATAHWRRNAANAHLAAGRFVMDRAETLSIERTLATARRALCAASTYAWDVFANEMSTRDVGEVDISEALRSVLC